MMVRENDETAVMLQDVCNRFRIPGKLVEYHQIISGHINSTYKVICETEKNGKTSRIDYIAQKVNQYVFHDPVAIMQNIDLMTSHMMKKRANAGSLTRRNRLHFHHTAEGKNYFFTPEGDFWRLTNFVDRATAYETTTSPMVLRMVGKAFGDFQAQLSDFDASQLIETIPFFHDTEHRLEVLFADADQDICGRRAEVEEELAWLKDHAEQMSRLCRKQKDGTLPTRATHNDTKSNNVLLDDDTLEPLVVLDLDTSMPGLAAYDFGDAVRFAASTAPENERDLSKVALNLELYRAFAEGFVSSTASFMTKEELDSLAEGAVTITLELASRFLDDYLIGDKYFRIDAPDENLVRARCQLALGKDMITKFDEMSAIVQETAAQVRLEMEKQEY